MTPAWLWYPVLYEQPFKCSFQGGFQQKGCLKHLFLWPGQVSVFLCSGILSRKCLLQEQRKVPPSNFEPFSIFSIVITDLGWFRVFALGFPGRRWCRSGASQLKPLFPHLFSLSPLMISSDRHDSWINMQTQFRLPLPQNLHYAPRFRDEQNMEITTGFCRDSDEWMMRRGDFPFIIFW